MQNDAFDIYTTKSLPFRILPPKFRHRMYIPDAYRHIATLIPSRLLVYKVPLALDTSIVGKKTAAKPTPARAAPRPVDGLLLLRYHPRTP